MERLQGQAKELGATARRLEDDLSAAHEELARRAKELQAKAEEGDALQAALQAAKEEQEVWPPPARPFLGEGGEGGRGARWVRAACTEAPVATPAAGEGGLRGWRVRGWLMAQATECGGMLLGPFLARWPGPGESGF